MRWCAGVFLACASCVAAFGCGDPIATGDFAGEPLLSFEGRINLVTTETQAPLRASLFWSPSGELDRPMTELFEDNAVTVTVTFPSTFQLNVFRPPRREWLVQDGSYGVAAILVYEDTLGQGRFVAGETPIRGGAPFDAVLYAPEEVPAERSPIDAPFGSGMITVRLPLPCGLGLDPPPPGLPECALPRLGKACTNDGECDARGICLERVASETFPGGYCSAVDDDTCPTSDSESVRFDLNSTAYFVRACAEDAQCRVDEGYVCDPIIKACLPVLPVELDIDDSFLAPSLCIEE